MKRPFLTLMTVIATSGPVGADLVSHYTFDETSGTTAFDSGPAEAHGIIGSNVDLGTPGRHGTAFTFRNDASSKGIVDMGNAVTLAAINSSRMASLSFWLKWTASADNRDSVIFLGNDTVSDRYLDVGTLGGTNTPNLGGIFGRCRAASSYPDLKTASGLNDGSWQHVAYTANALTGTTRLYVNGVLAASSTSSSLSFPSFNNLEVGRLGRSSPADAFSGSVDELRIHDSILSAADIASLAELAPADPLLQTATFQALQNHGTATTYGIPLRNEGASQMLLLGNEAVTVSGPDASCFTPTGWDNPIAPGAAGEVRFSFDPAASGGAERAYLAKLTIVSNDSRSPSVEVDLRITVSAIIIDGDNDGLPDDWETSNGLDPGDDGSTDPANGAFGDPDGDGVTNIEELRLGSNPTDSESPDARTWEPRPEKANLMFISAHPDDEGIFFGGAYAYYTRVRRLQVIGLSMTSGDAVLAPAVREGEFRNAVRTYGLRNPPIFPRFKDSRTTTLDETWDLWADGMKDGKGIAEGRQLAARTIALWIRRYRPDVIATHDFLGEYGHMNHQATAIATRDALPLAADPQENLRGLAPWQVKKLYSHLYPSGRLFHDHWEELTIDSDGDGTPDTTPRQITNTGMTHHVTQGKPKVSTVHAAGEVRPEWGAHPSEWWGLVESTVGPDTVEPDFTGPDPNNTPMTYTGWARGRFFENIIAFPDTDCDGLPDDWELAGFQSATAADPDGDGDGDGIRNGDEFIMGTDPATPDSNAVAVDPAGSSVSLLVPPASGPGYEGLVRRYRLLASGDLREWSVLREGIAEGERIDHPLPAGETSFFRLATELDVP